MGGHGSGGHNSKGKLRDVQCARLDGAVIAIDTFLGSPEHWDPNYLGHLMQRQHGRLLLYEQFLSNVLHTGTQDLIVPLAQTSESAAVILSRLQVCAGLIHIDAAHDYESIFRDARNYWQLLEPGGYLIGDDYDPGYPSVVRAAKNFAEFVGQPLGEVAPKWIIRKP
jgi:hypothetical protein